jgi:Spy/CpxP family protein refolding chaperone
MMLTAKVMLLTATAAGSGALGMGALHAYGRHCSHGGGRHGAMMHKFVDFAINEKLDEIGATDAQKQKVGEIKDRLMARGEALRGERKAAHEEILEQLSRDQPDAARVHALVKERTESFARFADDVTTGVLELHAVLTPEQRQKLLAHAREHMQGHDR